MAPTSKENEVLTVPPEAPAAPTAFRPDETSSRPSPVALEIPVTVNGARTVEGSDKREPFSETTKTVLVFGNGAVIRLSSPVAAGQLLFLTNEKTKKEVVCQVVKSKNYRSVSGYVELEFTESVVGFWGMRFPTDRVVQNGPAAVPPAAKAPVVPVTQVPKSVAPAMPAAAVASTPKAPEMKPLPVPVVPQVVQQVSAETKPAAHASVQPSPFPQTASSALPAAKTPEGAAASTNIAASLASSVANLLGSPEIPPGAVTKQTVPVQPAPTPAPAGQGGASTEELRLQAARLQEQLSSMLFSGPEAKPGVEASAPMQEAKSATTKVFDLLKSEIGPTVSVPPLKSVPAPIKSSLDTEQVKIPSWLEPLARNAAAPTSTQELIEREKARHAAELATHEEVKPEPLAAASPSSPEAEAPAIAGLPALEEDFGTITQPQPAGGSKRGLWIGVAAAVVLAGAGGGWYFLRSSNAAQGSTVPLPRASSPQTVAAPATPSVQPNNTTTQSAVQNTVAVAEPAPAPSNPQPVANSATSKPAVNSQQIAPVRDTARGSNTPIPASSKERIAPAPASAVPAATAAAAQPESKKPSIGDVHLASPTVKRATRKEDAVAAPSLSSGDADESSPILGEGLVDNAKQPSAPAVPLPMGGDVRPARLISKVAAVYPSLAKSQRVSGDVTIDALIDANGKVTTMKVMSGPQLLRQAAMDALRQWKYQPASLDGSAVPMHLTVNIQFRLQ